MCVGRGWGRGRLGNQLSIISLKLLAYSSAQVKGLNMHYTGLYNTVNIVMEASA